MAHLTRRSFLGRTAALAATTTLSGASSVAAPAERPGAVRIVTHTAGEPGMWVNSHLVVGENESLLIDAQMLRADAEAVADLVAGAGRPLRRIVITHAHPDHFLGTSWLLARFPQAEVLAPAPVAASIRKMGAMARGFVADEFGEDAAGSVVVPGLLPAGPLVIDDLSLTPHLLSGGECEHTLVLSAPESRELLSSDLLYAGTHLYLGDRDLAGWRANLDWIAALGPTWARPGHGRPALAADLVNDTRRYLADFERVTRENKTRADAESAMLALYPTFGGARLLRFSLNAYYPAA